MITTTAVLNVEDVIGNTQKSCDEISLQVGLLFKLSKFISLYGFSSDIYQQASHFVL
jgi:hypothetical protein